MYYYGVQSTVPPVEAIYLFLKQTTVTRWVACKGTPDRLTLTREFRTSRWVLKASAPPVEIPANWPSYN